MRQSRIGAVDHVHREASPGLDEELRWFYTAIGCLDEVSDGLADMDRLCFRSEGIELRLRLVACPRIDPTGHAVKLAVPSLSEAAELLDERGLPYECLTGITWADSRLATNDPAGNRVELKQQWPGEPL